jgi:hypothetical protein
MYGFDAYGADIDRRDVEADTTRIGEFFKPTSADLVVTDLPYGIQHGSHASGKVLARSPLDLLRAAAPVRAKALRPGGALGISWNTLVARREDAADALAPDCKTGCPLSGDGTTSLWDMTWRTWDSAVAAGSGTEKLDDCTPDCATGTLHAVPVSVVPSRPAMLYVSGTGRWFWTRVSFTWPTGLPAAFSGGNAPVNPFDYPDITAQSAKSCP